MSDIIMKIIPVVPTYTISKEMDEKVIECLKKNVCADDISVRFSEKPQFVDCGDNLENIHCPFCKEKLYFGWWGEAMNKASESDFENLIILLPCCGKQVSLNDLDYHFPCGFSCVEFDVFNPLAEPDEACLNQVKEILGVATRIIWAHL